MITRVLVIGEGGQGVLTLGRILAQAAFFEKKETCFYPEIGIEQRTTPVSAYVSIGNEVIGFPKFWRGDVIMALSERSLELAAPFLSPQAIVLYDSSSNPRLAAEPQGRFVRGIPALATAQAELVPRVFNLIFLGALVGATKIVSPDSCRLAMEKCLADKIAKRRELLESNLAAFQKGRELIRELIRT